MAKENLIGIKAKNCLNPSILKQSGCATAGSNTTLVIVNWQFGDTSNQDQRSLNLVLRPFVLDARR